jgi:hypothetical protein
VVDLLVRQLPDRISNAGGRLSFTTLGLGIGVVSLPLISETTPLVPTIPTPFEPNISVVLPKQRLPVQSRKVYLIGGETPYSARHWNTAIARKGGDAYLLLQQPELDLTGLTEYAALVATLSEQGYRGVAFQTEASSRRFGKTAGVHMFDER